MRLQQGLRRWRQPLVEVVLALAVAVAAAVVLRGPSVSQRFTIDESRWIATSRYFWVTFIDGAIFGPQWAPNYVVLTHPPVARYIIGFGLWTQGWTEDQLNGRYDSLRTASYNARMGNIPGPELLAAARRTTFPFAVGAMVLVYLAARQLAGRLAGLGAAMLALANPLLTTLWTRALAESILAFFSLLALVMALRALPRLAGAPSTPFLPLALGVSLALAAATKLSGGIAAVGLGLFAIVQQGLALIRTKRTAGLRSWVDVGLAAVILFVLANPLLYPAPVPRTLALIEHRFDEMEFQQDVFETRAVPVGIGHRIERMARRVFSTNATPAGPLPISPDVVLVAAGLIVLAVRAARDLRQGRAGAALLFVCWMAAFYAVSTASLGFDSAHYYAPLVAANAICSGVAIGWAIRAAVRAVFGLRWSGRRAGQKTQIPAT